MNKRKKKPSKRPHRAQTAEGKKFQSCMKIYADLDSGKLPRACAKLGDDIRYFELGKPGEKKAFKEFLNRAPCVICGALGESLAVSLGDDVAILASTCRACMQKQETDTMVQIQMQTLIGGWIENPDAMDGGGVVFDLDAVAALKSHFGV